MNLPLEYKNKIENLASNISLKKLKDIFTSLSDTYSSNNNKGISALDSYETALTYALTRTNATYGAFSDMFLRLNNEYDLSFINTVLDVGGGIASNSYFVKAILNKDLNITMIEKNKYMIDIAKTVFPDVVNQYINDDFLSCPLNDHYDMIICSYSLNEIKQELRLEFIKKLFKLTNLLVIVEPGTPFNHQELQEIKHTLVKEKGYVIAPCLFQENCPLKDNDWCHFITRIERSKIHKYLKEADVPYEDEKYSYLVMSKTKPQESTDYRILRHPTLTKNSITFKCCGNKMTKDICIFKKDKEYFKLVKKKVVGDILK